MRFSWLVLFLILAVAGAKVALAQNYGLGKPVTAQDIKNQDILVGPDGKELPAGKGSAKDGAPIFAQKCAACHGEGGFGGPAPMLVKNPAADSGPCLNPCIRSSTVMGVHAPFATIIWDFINRGMPFLQEGTLKPDEVYALTAFILYKNGVIGEDEVLDASSLPKVKMPNRDGWAAPEWKKNRPLAYPSKP